MPAEGAARLLTLSLLEQLSFHVPQGDSYRGALNRLRGCITIYDAVLGDSVSRKVRRRIRTVTKLANELYDVDVQLAWLTRIARTEHAPDAAAEVAVPRVSAQGALAANWLVDRLRIRRERLATRLSREQEDTRPFRRLAKRLSVYTTAVQLEDVTSMTFASLTGARLGIAIATLRATMAALTPRSDAQALRRTRRAADHVLYLLDPVRSALGADALAEAARELRHAVESVRERAIVADVLIASGRRIGAMQMTSRVRRVIWSCDDHSIDTASVLSDEIGPGVLALAERLRVECASAFEDVAARWLPVDRVALFGSIEDVASMLERR